MALVQAEQVRALLAKAHGVKTDEIHIEIVSTAGDRSQQSNRPLSEIGGKGLFSKEIEDQLLTGNIDIAVHSAKDMATTLPDNLIMPVFLPREDVRDCFISLKAKTLGDLPQGATIGTSSLRRRAQLLRLRPDLNLIEFRGNVGTRLQKLEDGIADATMLAAAGLLRTGQGNKITTYLDTKDFPPAPAQGAIGIELRNDNTRALELVAPLNHPDTKAAIIAERAFLRVLDGSCRTPIAALTTHKGEQLELFGQILSPDGRQIFETTLTGAKNDSEALGRALGEKLLAQAGPAFMAALKDNG